MENTVKGHWSFLVWFLSTDWLPRILANWTILFTVSTEIECVRRVEHCDLVPARALRIQREVECSVTIPLSLQVQGVPGSVWRHNWRAVRANSRLLARVRRQACFCNRFWGELSFFRNYGKQFVRADMLERSRVRRFRQDWYENIFFVSHRCVCLSMCVCLRADVCTYVRGVCVFGGKNTFSESIAVHHGAPLLEPSHPCSMSCTDECQHTWNQFWFDETRKCTMQLYHWGLKFTFVSILFSACSIPLDVDSILFDTRHPSVCNPHEIIRSKTREKASFWICHDQKFLTFANGWPLNVKTFYALAECEQNIYLPFLLQLKLLSTPNCNYQWNLSCMRDICTPRNVSKDRFHEDICNCPQQQLTSFVYFIQFLTPF